SAVKPPVFPCCLPVSPAKPPVVPCCLPVSSKTTGSPVLSPGIADQTTGSAILSAGVTSKTTGSSMLSTSVSSKASGWSLLSTGVTYSSVLFTGVCTVDITGIMLLAIVIPNTTGGGGYIGDTGSLNWVAIFISFPYNVSILVDLATLILVLLLITCHD
ncbi:hypothetical protein V8G54_011284, partial [Vigna mungo]